ncbi:MAG: glutamate--tRNA ligase [Gemmatimonadota bacterium]
MGTRSPRVRFAPSPTGHLHVGGARTALFNYLFARHTGGTFLLRIEDTDRTRSSEEMTQAILDALEWLDLGFDEEPVHQADGLERHRRDVSRLLQAGAAYRCFCTSEELERRRSESTAQGIVYRYDGRCRRLDPAAAERRAESGEAFAVRFAVPGGETAWEDVVHGRTAFANTSLEDFVILRSDGTPVYNLAVVSDDIEMRVSHVIRGDDHISNTPKQILIYRALGTPEPTFAHVPMILGPDGKRLSKRHGATSVEAYRQRGILPEAMVNFLALLGWSPGDDREVMSKDELVEAFTLERILKKSAVFDTEKLEWLNGRYLARAPVGRLVPLLMEVLGRVGIGAAEVAAVGRERVEALVEQLRVRARTIEEMGTQAAPYFTEGVDYDPKAVAEHWKDPAGTRETLLAVRSILASVQPYEPKTLEAELRDLAARMGVGAGKLIHPLRVAVLGVAASPGIFQVLFVIGRKRCLERIDRALARLAESTASDDGQETSQNKEGALPADGAQASDPPEPAT